MNITDPIMHHCRTSATSAALASPGSALNIMSYGRLERSIHSVCRKVLGLGFRRGNVIALFFDDHLMHAVIVLALTRLGIVTVSGSNPNLPRELHVDAVLTDINFPYPAIRVLRADAGWLTGDDSPLQPEHVHCAAPDDLCRVVLTSGTTGEGKAVALSHRMLASRIARHQYAFGNRLPACGRTYIDLGLPTSLGFQFLIAVLWRGGTLFVPGPDQQLTIRAFEAYRIQNIVTSPGGLTNLLRGFDAHPNAQPALDTVFSGGSVLPGLLSERVRARICANLMTAYGSTETSMVAAALAHTISPVTGAVGFVLPGARVEIVDESGSARPRGAEGIVRIRSASNVAKYLANAEESAKVFQDGWFYPGDTGYLRSDNLLVVSGRQKAVLNLGGDKLKPEAVEDVLNAFEAVEEAAVFTMASEWGVDELWAAVVPRGNFDEAALKAHCQRKLPQVFVPAKVVTAAALPRNAMGKVDRTQLPQLARAKLN